MAIPYRQILDAMVTGLTGLATTSTRVYESPAYALAAGTWPALVIEPRGVSVGEVFGSSDGDAHLERQQLTVAVTSVGTTTGERDTSALEVAEAVLAGFRPGFARRFSRTEFGESREGERALFMATQHFEIDYHVEATAPGVIVT